ncbi:MAG: hypothetical protein ACK59A_00120 [Cyanobacteriota bacterium]
MPPLPFLRRGPLRRPSGPDSRSRSRGVLGWLLAPLLGLGLATGGCQRGPSEEMRRLDRVDLKIQQLEQRLNKLSVPTADGADKAGKPPAGVIKSLTFRLGSEDDRLRIYWADGSNTDLPCTKEQSTYVCG